MFYDCLDSAYPDFYWKIFKCVLSLIKQDTFSREDWEASILLLDISSEKEVMEQRHPRAKYFIQTKDVSADLS